jgi:hypothetical protein
MKSFIIITLATLGLFSYAEANVGLITSLAQKCKKAENASDADVDRLAHGKAPETPEGKCLAGKLYDRFFLFSLKFFS